MDPITLILTALAAGAAGVAKGTLSEAGKEAYQGLKMLIQRKLAGKPKAEVALAEHAEEPDLSEVALRKALTDAAAEKDEEIIQAAQTVLALVNPQQAAMGKYNVQITGDVQGFVQGDTAQVTMSFGDKPEEE